MEEIRRLISADTLGYLSVEGLRGASSSLKHGICDGCFSDEYPVAIDEDQSRPQLSLFRPVGEEGEI